MYCAGQLDDDDDEILHVHAGSLAKRMAVNQKVNSKAATQDLVCVEISSLQIFGSGN